jgi:hypothetical protein
MLLRMYAVQTSLQAVLRLLGQRQCMAGVHTE